MLAKEKCEHIIGMLYDNSDGNDLVSIKTLRLIIKEHKSFNEEVKKNGFEGVFHREDDISKYLDNRRNYIYQFKHCPECGKKIDWEQLRRDNK